jgi:hypothetical protein
MRPMVAVAVAMTAIVLGSGVSAAITGGRSVNPLDGIEQVVAVVTHGRTEDQQNAYEEVERDLVAAQAAAEKRDDTALQDHLGKISKSLLQRLNDDDRTNVLARIDDLKKKITH